MGRYRWRFRILGKIILVVMFIWVLLDKLALTQAPYFIFEILRVGELTSLVEVENGRCSVFPCSTTSALIDAYCIHPNEPLANLSA
jgi:hypothetical protein